MLNETIDGICEVLAEAFPSITIYTEQVKQGLKTPCFIISCVNPSNKHVRAERYRRNNLFSVQYIPQSGLDAKAECCIVLDALYQSLEYINISGDLTRGTGMSAEFTDGVLTFFVNYNMFVRRKNQKDLMETLTVEYIPR